MSLPPTDVNGELIREVGAEFSFSKNIQQSRLGEGFSYTRKFVSLSLNCPSLGYSYSVIGARKNSKILLYFIGRKRSDSYENSVVVGSLDYPKL